MKHKIAISASALGVVLSVAAWGLSYTYWSACSPRYIWRLFNGTFSVQERGSSTPRWYFACDGFAVARQYARGWGIMDEITPTIRKTSRRGNTPPFYRQLVLPLWIPTLLSTGLFLLVVRQSRRAQARAREGLCTACGYDLTGSLSGRCPECGVRRENRLDMPDSFNQCL